VGSCGPSSISLSVGRSSWSSCRCHSERSKKIEGAPDETKEEPEGHDPRGCRRHRVWSSRCSGMCTPQVSGTYFDDDGRPKEVSKHATPDLADELWSRSEAWVAEV